MTEDKQKPLGIKMEGETTNVEKYEFEPIQGYPMLNWKGKRPFTSTQYYPAQLKEVHGEEVNGWRNKIYWGDNLQIMSHLLKKFRGKIDFVYIDPPFNSNAEYKITIRLREKQLSSQPTFFEEKQYSDIWTNDEYLQFIYERLILIRELLTQNGVIAVHCDFNKDHHIRCILDEIFGSNNFLNDIIWYYENKPQFGFMKHLPRDHDVILVYAKSFGDHSFTHQQVPVKKIQQQAQVGWDPILKKRIAQRDDEGNIIYITRKEKYMGSVWTLPLVHPIAKERTGYPTQKPESLLEKLIMVYSKHGDIVLDSFMGAGTTQVVAMKLGRRFIGSDINLAAIQITEKRLLEVAETLEKKNQQGKIEIDGEKSDPLYTGFEVNNVNYYELFRNPVEAKDLLLEALEVHRLEKGLLFDGEKDGRMIKVMPVNRIATRADLAELISGFDYKTYQKRQNENPNKPVEKITLVCMGHEPDLGAYLEKEMLPLKINVEVIDILRDKQEVIFKRDAEAKISKKKGWLEIRKFYPMDLLQKLSLEKEKVGDWRELVESVMIDWNYDGSVLNPAVTDIPDQKELVKGKYKIPETAGTIRVKITDLLSESLEIEVENG